jgi:hypothetical protein
MFFSKKDKDPNKRVVAVVGTSPLALFLTCVLQQNNVDVIVVNTLRKNKSEKEESWFLKNVFHGQSFSFSSCDALKKKPDYCFLASSFDEYKSDVLFLSDNMLRDVPVINFASFYNHKIIEQSKNINEIRAYFEGWLVKGKKEITILNRGIELNICCEENIEKDLQEILNDKKVDIKQCKNSQKIFWQKKLSWFLGNLLILAYEEDVSKLLLNNEIRQNVDGAIKEVCQILSDVEPQLNTQKLLTDIYAFPDGYVSEYNSSVGCISLCEMVGVVDYFSHPKLFELIKRALKKY